MGVGKTTKRTPYQVMHIIPKEFKNHPLIKKIGIKNISKIILSNECKEIWDDVYSDLINCIKARAIVGKGNFFFEKIIEVYLSGGWPCGWEGNFPNGRMKVSYTKK